MLSTALSLPKGQSKHERRLHTLGKALRRSPESFGQGGLWQAENRGAASLLRPCDSSGRCALVEGSHAAPRD